MNKRQRHDALRALTSGPGWPLLAEEFAGRRESLVSRMLAVTATDAERREFAAEVRSIDALLRWPDQQCANLARAMDREA